MHHDHLFRRRPFVALVLLAFLLAPACAGAAQYSIDNRQSQSNYVPGTFVDLATPAGVDYQARTTDIFGDPVSYYSYAAVCDTGASGNVISAYEAQARACDNG